VTGLGCIVENNLDSPPGTIDLHGLYVKEGASCHVNPHTVRILTIAGAERRFAHLLRLMMSTTTVL
jgi:hypothetical protein